MHMAETERNMDEGPYPISVNGRQYTHKSSKSISYIDICGIAGKTKYTRSPAVTFYVIGNGAPRTLRPPDEVPFYAGGKVDIEQGMVFNVAYTGTPAAHSQSAEPR